MGLGRLVGRVIGGVIGLGVLALVLTVGIPLLLMAIAAVVGAALLFTVGLPVLLIGALVAIAVVALVLTTVGLASFGILLLKVAIALVVLSWLFRLIAGRSRKSEPVLVGRPIAEVSAPRRDKYDVEAERELDRELGL